MAHNDGLELLLSRDDPNIEVAETGGCEPTGDDSEEVWIIDRWDDDGNPADGLWN